MTVTTPQLSHHRRREEEQQWRDDGKFLVTFFGMLGYEIVAVCDTEEEATEVCTLWQICATLGSLAKGNADLGMRVPGWTRHAYPWDFDVRTQDDLDSLTRAILESYR